MTIAWHDGPREPLRHLFELADDSAQQIDGYIEHGRVLVARDRANRIIGHAQTIATESLDTIELKSIAVLPDYQRRGLGRALVEHLVTTCGAEGISTITVTTATADVDNVRFYQRLGFRASSIERDAFTEAKGYPRALEADGIPVRDGITFTLGLGSTKAQPADRNRSEPAASVGQLRHRRKEALVITKGLIVRLEAKPGAEELVAELLRDALALVQQERETIAWFAFRIDAASFAIIDVFPDEAGRRAHLDGAVAAALEEKGLELLARPPLIESVDVLADKLP